MKYASGFLVVIGCSVAVAGQPFQRTLSFEDRVKAQTAIEQVYWNHRIWPKENPGPKPPLAAAMGDRAIREKVMDYLRKSDALDTWWKRPMTAEQLQAEMDRMAKSTRDATLLRELFDAIGNDPFVIAETLGRQALADRLIRSWYANDTRFHGVVQQRAARAIAGLKNAQGLKSLDGDYRESTWVRSEQRIGPPATKNDDVEIEAADWPETISQLGERFGGRGATGTLPVNTLSSLKETADDLSVVMLLESSPDRVRVASVLWPKIGFETWWMSQRTSTEVPRDVTAASQRGYVLPVIADSARTPDTWQPTRFEMPVSRHGHTVVWTGSEMIVWGGENQTSVATFNNGAR